MAFGTRHIAACCPGNVNRAMPNYASRLWMTDKEGGLVAALYGPSVVTFRAGAQQQEVTVTEETRYPFSDRILFVMKMEEDTTFGFTVRIPGWCNDAKIFVNNQPLENEAVAGTFVRIERTFHDGDEVSVVFPQEVRATQWPLDGIAVERGPLVYSLKIEEEWQSLEDVARAADSVLGIYGLMARYPGLVAHNVYPRSPWNYALDIHTGSVSSKVQVIQNDWQDEHPWSGAAPPITLRVPARRIDGWTLDEESEVILEGDGGDPELRAVAGANRKQEHSRKGRFVFTPQLPDRGTSFKLGDATELITLVPYGCAKLRLTTFPCVEKIS